MANKKKIWKLNENRTRVRFEKRVKELVSTDAPELWKTFKNGFENYKRRRKL